MRYLFSWDGEVVTMQAQPYSNEKTLERVLSKGRKAFAPHLEQFSNGDELDEVELQWFQVWDKPNKRDELEAEYPHLAGYRGATEAPARPDVSAAVLADVKAWAQRWYDNKYTSRTTDFTVTSGAHEIVMTPDHERLLVAAATNHSLSGVWQNVTMKSSEGHRTFQSWDASVPLNAVWTQYMDQIGSSSGWRRGRWTAIDDATTTDSVIAELT